MKPVRWKWVVWRLFDKAPMSFRRLPMKQLKEVARLRFGLKRSYSEISASLGIARSTVQEVVKRLQGAKLGWPLAPELDDDHLYAQLYPPSSAVRGQKWDFFGICVYINQ
jgi:hypothetical protein